MPPRRQAKEAKAIEVKSSPAAEPSSEQNVLEKEAVMLVDCYKRATVTTAEIIQFCSIVKKQHVPHSQTALPKTLIAKLGRDLERYDQLIDVMQERVLQAMAVIKRDIDRETGRISRDSKAKAKAQAEVIEVSSDDEDVLPSKSQNENEQHKVDADGVIHLDSDSEGDIMQRARLRSSTSAPQGISLGTLQNSPPNNGNIIDLTMDTDALLASPTAITQDPFSPQKRGSMSLRLDLSSEALAGVPFSSSGAPPPSPVTLAPKTARPMSAHPSLTGSNSYFGDGNASDPSMLSGLLSTLVSHTQGQHDVIGSAGGTNMMDLSAPPSGVLDSAHQMDLDLFGEIVEDDDDHIPSSINESMAAGSQQDGGLGLSLDASATASFGQRTATDAMSMDNSQASQTQSSSFPTESFISVGLSTNSGDTAEISSSQAPPPSQTEATRQHDEVQQRRDSLTADPPPTNSAELIAQIGRLGAEASDQTAPSDKYDSAPIVDTTASVADASMSTNPNDIFSPFGLSGPSYGMGASPFPGLGGIDSPMYGLGMDGMGMGDVGIGNMSMDFSMNDYLSSSGAGSDLMNLDTMGGMSIGGGSAQTDPIMHSLSEAELSAMLNTFDQCT